MNERLRSWGVGLVLLVAVVFSPILAEAAEWFAPRDAEPSERLDLPVPNYGWWHGCSPTSAGMLLGYYDRHYAAVGGLNRILNGYTAPSENWCWWPWLCGVDDDSPANILIDSLRNFMHTDSGGGTSMPNIPTGIEDHVEYSSLRAESANHSSFTWDQYKAEILAGRPVLIHISDAEDAHSMCGIGFDSREGRRNAVFYDTWDHDSYHWMDWDGTYEGMSRYSVTTVRFLLPELRVSGEDFRGATKEVNLTPEGYCLDWGNRLVGKGAISSETDYVIIENVGGMDYAFRTTQSSPWNFWGADGAAPPSLWAGEGWSMPWLYMPVVRGPLSAEFTFEDTSPLGLDTTLLVQGNGVAPQASFNFTHVGPMRIGTNVGLSLTVTNVGDGNLSPEPWDESNLRGTIAAGLGNLWGLGGSVYLWDGREEEFRYLYTPTQHGDVARVSYDFANGKPDGTNESFKGVIEFGGVGVGPEFEGSIAPGSTIDFGEVNVSTLALLPFEITNVGLDECDVLPLTDLTLLDAVIEGPDGGLFSLPDFTPGMVLHQWDQVGFFLEFAPTSSAGPKEATLTFVTDQGAALGTPGESLVYTLVGIAVPEPDTLVLLVTGGLVLLAYAGRRRRAA